MDVRSSILDKQRRELQQEDAHSIRRAEGVVRVNDAIDEDADDVVCIVLVRWWRSTNQLLTVTFFKRVEEAWNDDKLQNLQWNV